MNVIAIRPIRSSHIGGHIHLKGDTGAIQRVMTDATGRTLYRVMWDKDQEVCVCVPDDVELTDAVAIIAPGQPAPSVAASSIDEQTPASLAVWPGLEPVGTQPHFSYEHMAWFSEHFDLGGD